MTIEPDLARRLLELSEIGEDFGAVFFGVHVEIGFADDALGIDEEGMAGGEFGDAQVYKGVVGGRDFVLCIGEELEGQAFFGTKLLVGSFILHTHTEDDRVFLFILRKVTLKIVSFLGAAASEILGIEIKHNPLAAKIMQAERLAILRIQREVRRSGAWRRRFASGAHGADNG